METKKPGCSCQLPAGACQACGAEEIFSYWCEQCERSVPEKRCPYCGLKARKKRQEPPG
jgi:predicted RNA-binding protein with PUA domain